MTKRRPELADVIRENGTALLNTYGASITAEHRGVLRAVANCRTAALGGHKVHCDRCGNEGISYNSCRNRHCPKCQAAARAKWLEDRADELLDVEYFHVVFTLPDRLGPIALQNKTLIYNLLFRAASETILTIAKDAKHLGADVGFLAVLHTWGQNLELHPHVHCVVPGGGFTTDSKNWRPCAPGFFLPVRVLSRLFRKKFLALLREAFNTGDLRLVGRIRHLWGRREWRKLLQELDDHDWVVFAKAPFGGPKQVLMYLARYTHRVAISNQRIVRVKDGEVTFRWKDYRHGHRHRTMTLSGVEFLRRFLLHVLPRGFQRIRYYGFLSNRVRKERLELCRQLLRQRADAPPAGSDPVVVEPFARDSLARCPACGRGHMVIVCELKPNRDLALAVFPAPAYDTS